MSIMVHQVPYTGGTNGQVYPITDRRLIDFISSGKSGVVTGCDITNPSGNTLSIASGWGIAKGCIFTIAAENVSATVASSGTMLGELILQVDTVNSTASWITNVGNSATVLTEDDLTASDGVYEILFADYQIDTAGNITDLTEEFDDVLPGNIDGVVLASDGVSKELSMSLNGTTLTITYTNA